MYTITKLWLKVNLSLFKEESRLNKNFTIALRQLYTAAKLRFNVAATSIRLAVVVRRFDFSFLWQGIGAGVGI